MWKITLVTRAKLELLVKDFKENLARIHRLEAQLKAYGIEPVE